MNDEGYEIWDRERRKRWPHATHQDERSWQYGQLVADYDINYIRDPF